MRNQHQRAPMVGWFDPHQLIRTGVEVVISSIFGRQADRRLVQALISGKTLIHDYSSGSLKLMDMDQYLDLEPLHAPPPDEIWIDYVADVGEGWDSTYAVASAIAQPLDFSTGQDRHQTVPGQILVFGGDEVYPAASRKEYHLRLAKPYEEAFAGRKHYPDVFAIPGNHDWYDSLSSFSRLFGSDDPLFAPGDSSVGCKTPQRRSYFALKLPHGWWMLGTDVQLGSDLDGPQIDFFKAVFDHYIRAEDRVILCTPEPHWTYPWLKEDSSGPNAHAVEFLEKQLKDRLAVVIAGDVHHYRRMAAPDGTQRITAGGGSAFLHPTHTWPRKITDHTDKTFKYKKSYPSPAWSWVLGCGNLIFPFWKWSWNGWFLLPFGLLYLLVFWTLSTHLIMPTLEDRSFGLVIRTVVLETRRGILLLGVFVLGCWLFTDVRRRYLSDIMGIFHGVAHFVAALFIAWLVLRCVGPETEAEVSGRHLLSSGQYWLSTGLIFLLGGFVGSLIMGVYLFLSLNICWGIHWNAAFGSLAIPDWKNFLRLRIDKTGLTIYPIGICRVPRGWSGLLSVSDLKPELIEKPIEVKKSY